MRWLARVPVVPAAVAPMLGGCFANWLTVDVEDLVGKVEVLWIQVEVAWGRCVPSIVGVGGVVSGHVDIGWKITCGYTFFRSTEVSILWWGPLKVAVNLWWCTQSIGTRRRQLISERERMKLTGSPSDNRWAQVLSVCRLD